MDDKDTNRDVDFLATERLISNVGTGFMGIGLLIHAVGVLRIYYYTIKYLVFGP